MIVMTMVASSTSVDDSVVAAPARTSTNIKPKSPKPAAPDSGPQCPPILNATPSNSPLHIHAHPHSKQIRKPRMRKTRRGRPADTPAALTGRAQALRFGSALRQPGRSRALIEFKFHKYLKTSAGNMIPGIEILQRFGGLNRHIYTYMYQQHANT